MIESAGSVSIAGADSSNIPVHIRISPVSDNPNYKWVLQASNYCPRKSCVYEDVYEIFSDSEDELRNLIREKILPLYMNAVTILLDMINGDGKELYYWDPIDKSEQIEELKNSIPDVDHTEITPHVHPFEDVRDATVKSSDIDNFKVQLTDIPGRNKNFIPVTVTSVKFKDSETDTQIGSARTDPGSNLHLYYKEEEGTYLYSLNALELWKSFSDFHEKIRKGVVNFTEKKKDFDDREKRALEDLVDGADLNF